MIIVGIDPGLKGAIATLSNGRPAVRIMPTLKMGKSKLTLDERLIFQILKRRAEAIEHVFIEKVSAMPGQGVTSCFNFGCGWGVLRGICVGLQLPYTLVHPTTWKRVMCKDMPKGSKDTSIIIAKRLWPDVNLRPTPRSRKDSDGLADALLIAEYGRRLLPTTS